MAITTNKLHMSSGQTSDWRFGTTQVTKAYLGETLVWEISADEPEVIGAAAYYGFLPNEQLTSSTTNITAAQLELFKDNAIETIEPNTNIDFTGTSAKGTFVVLSDNSKTDQVALKTDAGDILSSIESVTVEGLSNTYVLYYRYVSRNGTGQHFFVKNK